MNTKSNKLLLVAGLCIALGVGLCVRGESETMATGYPDWTRAVALIGQDPDGNLILIKVDADGQLTVPFKGVNPDEDLMTVAVDKDGQLYSIMKGREGNVLAVDVHGFMTAVLKGEYGDELRTIGLDDDGRISGYLVDDTDLWGKILRVGNAEQAARLGSPVAWDRRGNVQLIHTFGNGMGQFRILKSETNASVGLSPLWAMTDGYTCRMAAGPGTDKDATIEAGLGKPPSLRVGLSVRFSVYPVPTYFKLVIGVYSEGMLSIGQVRYDYGNDRPEYCVNGGEWEPMETYKLEATTHVADLMKLVIDAETGKYVRLLLNSKQYDMTADLPGGEAPDSGNFVVYSLKVYGAEAEEAVVYVDTVVLTVNEP